MLSPRSVLVTGSNRGLGLEFVKQIINLPSPPKHVFAACRNPDAAQELQDLCKLNKSITLIQIDIEDTVTMETAMRVVEEKVRGEGLSLLINNAGVLYRDDIESLSGEKLAHSFSINCTGPLMMTKIFLPLLKRAAGLTGLPMSCNRAAVINISTIIGSIADNMSGKQYAYRCSKAALNMATKGLAMDLKDSGILVSAVHPGWVQTDMGGPSADLSPIQSVSKVIDILSSLEGPESTGVLFHTNGQPLPW